MQMPMRAVRISKAISAFLAICAAYCGSASADYIAIQTPTGLGSALVTDTTAQWLGSVTVNPFFAGTWQLVLTGPNPSFNPPVTAADLLNALVETSTHTYKYGFADGLDQQRITDQNVSWRSAVDCSTPSLLGWTPVAPVACSSAIALSSNTIAALLPACASAPSQISAFGTSGTIALCQAMIPAIVNYVTSLSTQCASAPTPIALETQNCNEISLVIGNSIYQTQFDSTTLIIPNVP